MKTAIITGPRVIAAQDEKLVRDVVREVIARGFKIYVGDATGVDWVVSDECFQRSREHLSWSDFSKRDFMKVQWEIFYPLDALGRTPAGIAERSTRMVKEALRDYENTQEGFDHGAFREDPHGEIICIGFPNKPCPAGIVPARSWRSVGSGTWSTLAFAIGYQIETWIVPLSEMSLSHQFISNRAWSNLQWQQFGKEFTGFHFTPSPDFFNTVPANSLSHDEKANGWTELAHDESADEYFDLQSEGDK